MTAENVLMSRKDNRACPKAPVNSAPVASVTVHVLFHRLPCRGPNFDTLELRYGELYLHREHISVLLLTI